MTRTLLLALSCLLLPACAHLAPCPAPKAAHLAQRTAVVPVVVVP